MLFISGFYLAKRFICTAVVIVMVWLFNNLIREDEKRGWKHVWVCAGVVKGSESE